MTPTLEITLFVLALCGAFVSGLVGVGGAIVMIPLLYYAPPLLGAGELPIKAVAGLSMTQVLAAAVAGTWSHGRHALVHGALALTGQIPPALTVVLGSLTGARLGGRVSRRVPVLVLRGVLAGIITLVMLRVWHDVITH